MPAPHPHPARTAARNAVSLPLLVAILAAAVAAPAAAQRTPREDLGRRPRVLEVGAHLGYEATNDGFVLGVQARLPVDPWLRIEVLPAASVEFLDRITEYQLDADAALMLDRSGSFYFGGGAAFRNTVFDFVEGELGDLGGEREWRTGYNLFVGLRAPPDRDGGLAGQLELRWTTVEQFDLQIVRLGVNYPLAIL